ncbi:hypothetical protein GCM10022384_55870 [Streptomyces marokkonensis]|uniref:Uncharacterized protein n=2 Tax=Streptomyces marokkonensis TaxID=324855 RepID=A0ABP7RT42_9ACTN
MNGWDEGEVKKAIGADGREDLHVALLVPLGYPAESRLHPGRRDRAPTHQGADAVLPAGWGQVLG